MTERPLIGITCGTTLHDPKASAPQDRLNRAYSRAVWEAGGLPVIVPNTDSDGPAALLERLDGLLLSGGVDVHPALYGEARLNETVEMDEDRDRTEMGLARSAVEQGLPVMAICRGIQALNVALGGTLWQDLPAQCPSDIPHRQAAPRDAATHAIHISPDSRLARIVGGTAMDVNTFHHQALKAVAAVLRVTARAADGVVEAVESVDGRFVIGVQFHPEEMIEVSPEARSLFHAFVGEAGGIQRRRGAPNLR